MTRRRLLQLAALGSAALAGCGGGGGGERELDPEADAALLNTLLELEHTAVAVYAAAGLGGAARRFGDHERQHAERLSRAIRRLGGSPVAPKPLADYERGFPALRTSRDALRLAVDLENTAVAAYIDALPKLTDPALRATVAATLTVEAEHMSVLLGELGEPQVPRALVTGRETG
jgi:bacterioferritin (cytochrome b1)